jgi:hypothetical protein
MCIFSRSDHSETLVVTVPCSLLRSESRTEDGLDEHEPRIPEQCATVTGHLAPPLTQAGPFTISAASNCFAS